MRGLAYADDLTILSHTVGGFQKTINIGLKYSVTFNSRKSVCMCIGNMTYHFQPQKHLNGMALKLVKHKMQDFKEISLHLN